MTIRLEYEKNKEELISKINKSIQEFEIQTGTYLTKLDIKSFNDMALTADCFGWQIKKRSFLYEINSTIDTGKIEKIEGNLYLKDYNPW